ncbi:MAG: arginase family protein, partial [Candidatus Helarchaeota archaeon]|nr:arginase family protein [Candidatus Helarchaeota archaeon]
MPEFNFSQLEFADNIEFVILGIPLDCTSAKPTDSKNAPNKIREASNQFADYTELGFDLNQALIFDAGDIVVKNQIKHLELDLKEIDNKFGAFKSTKNIHFVVLGGDHFVTHPVFRYMTELHENLGLISFDAHLDLYNKWNESTFSNATVMRRICELPDFNLNNLNFIGIRDVDLEELEFVKKHQLKVLKSHEITQSNLNSVLH